MTFRLWRCFYMAFAYIYNLYLNIWMWLSIFVGIYLFSFLSFLFQDLSQFQAVIGIHIQKFCQNNLKVFVVFLFKICPRCCRLQAHWQWENFSQQLQFSTLCCFCSRPLYLLLDTTLWENSFIVEQNTSCVQKCPKNTHTQKEQGLYIMVIFGTEHRVP